MATETTTPVQQNPPSKLRKVYDFLVSQNKVRPGRSFEEFEERMQDPARLEKVFNYLKESNKVRAENFDQFQDSMGLKKKEHAFPGGVPMAQEPDPQSVQLVDQTTGFWRNLFARIRKWFNRGAGTRA